MKTIKYSAILIAIMVLMIAFSCTKSSRVNIDADGYGKFNLKNGITVLINHDQSTAITAADIIIKGGLFTENAEDNGITYLMVKMLLKGNDKMTADQIMDSLDFLGAQVATDAYRDFADISITCLSENFPATLSLIANSILAPAFSQTELDKLKIEVEGTLKAENDNQVESSRKLFRKTIYGNSGYGMPLLGTPETVNNITLDQIKNHYQRLVSGPNMVISIATDINPTEIAPTLEKEFGSLSNQPVTLDVPQIISEKEREGFISFDRNQSFIHLGFPLPHLSASEVPNILLLNEIMGANVGSRLWYLRQKEKLAYNVYSQYSLNKYDALFLGAIGTDTSKVGIAVASLRREMKKLYDEGITESELADAKVSILKSLIYRIERKSERAYTMASYEIIGYGYKFVSELLRATEGVTLDSINQFAKKYLPEDKQYLAIVGKK
jgi:zinc protease